MLYQTVSKFETAAGYQSGLAGLPAGTEERVTPLPPLTDGRFPKTERKKLTERGDFFRDWGF